MTREEFDQLLRDGSDEEVLEAVWDFLPETESDEETGYETGDPLALIAYADSEIRNGGFYQFYANGIFDSMQLPRLLEEIGAHRLADCIRQANELFPEGLPPYRGSREVEEVELELEDMGVSESTFGEVEVLYAASGGDLNHLMAEHIRANPQRYGP